jgi:uridine kinase
MKKSIIIGISGGSGSGKTSFIKALRKEINQDVMTIISQDDYYKPREQQIYDENGVQNFDLPSSLDLDAFVNDILKIKNGEIVKRLEYTFNNEKASAVVKEFHPASVIIVEGLFIFHEANIKSLLDYSIIVNAKDSDKIIRRIIRDQVERNYPLDDVLYRYKHHVIPSYDKYIKPYLDEVDIIINNNTSYDKGVVIITNFIKAITQL